MKLSKINLFGSLALGCSLMAGGLAQASASPLVANNRTDSQFVPKVKNGTVCKQVVANVKDVLETIPDVKVSSKSGFATLIGAGYSGKAPDNLNRHYTLTISGSGVGDFWESGKEVRLEIAKQIIQNCEGVAAVTFARDRTGESATIGLFPDGSIKQFTCRPDADTRTRPRPPLNWGQQDCDL